MLTITADVSADLKRLKNLEGKGLVEIHVVNIENHIHTRKIQKKEMPIAVIGSPHAKIGNAVVAGNKNLHSEIRQILGKEHHADILHLERHYNSGRDYFVTDDNDFLAKRLELDEALGLKIVTVNELEELLV